MNKKQKNLIILILITALLLLLYLIFFSSNSYGVNKLTSLVCKKSNNCCTKNEDCEYIWYTGSCNTPEYVAEVQKKASRQGRTNGEALRRENVSCTCDSNKCATHN